MNNNEKPKKKRVIIGGIEVEIDEETSEYFAGSKPTSTSGLI